MLRLTRRVQSCFLILMVLLLFALLNQYTALHGWGKPFIQCLLKSLLAVLVFFAALALDEHVLERFIPISYGIAVLLLFCVAIYGMTVKGATRWISVGHFSMQPSEIAKIFTPLMVAHMIYVFRYASPLFLFFMGCSLTLVPGFLIIKQPDLGSGLLLVGAGLLPLLITTIPFRFFFMIVMIVLSLLPLSWHYLHPYQQDRILTLLHPDRDPLGQGYHVQQSKIAIGSGGFFGKGFRFNTQADYSFLPEHDTDFAFALFAEEWGFIGCFIVILLFLILKVQLLYLIMETKSYYAQLIMFALIAPLFLYVTINIGMVSGLLPVVGVPLPFFSRGGTNLLSIMFSLGLVFSLHLKDRYHYQSY